MSAYDIYSTHAVPLAACVAWTKGPVLELGMGNGSSPLLHAMCKGRMLVSAETNLEWMEKFAPFKSEFHEFHLVKKWSDWSGIVGLTDRWSVALIDSQPGEERVDLIERLKGRCDWVLAHDCERDHATAADYKYEKVFGLFRYVREYKYLRPYTAILSDHEPFPLDPVETVWTPPPDCPCPECRAK